jgi:hypothetical protein
MKIHIVFYALLLTVSVSLRAGTPAQEKAFTDRYKTAFEGKDTATLESFLYTQGADPEILGFYKMMQSADAGEKISKIELVDLTPKEAKKAATPMESPTGGKVCLSLKPVKQLVIAIEKKDASGSSSRKVQASSPRKTANSLSPVRGRVSKIAVRARVW